MKSDQNRWNFAQPELRIQVLTCSNFMWSQLVVTWSMTLTGLPRVEANHELHHYKEKFKKMKVLSKTWVSPNNRLNISDQKLETFTFGIREQNKGTTKPQKQQATTEDGPCNQEEINLNFF